MGYTVEYPILTEVLVVRLTVTIQLTQRLLDQCFFKNVKSILYISTRLSMPGFPGIGKNKNWHLRASLDKQRRKATVLPPGRYWYRSYIGRNRGGRFKLFFL